MEMIQNNSEMINNSVNETGGVSSEGPLPGKCGARCTREEDQTHIGRYPTTEQETSSSNK